MTIPAPNPVVLVPTYNHGRFILGVLEGLGRLGICIIVVDDGSTDDTAELLATQMNNDPGRRLVLLRHEHNRGKAAALRTGFREALRAGFTHAIAIDADGQLDPADIPRLIKASRSHPEALVLGCRPAHSVGRPPRCELGRRSAGFAVRAQTGVWLGDTQCGLRSYPLEIVESLDCRAERFAFESEVITRMIWSGGEVIEVPVSCSYKPPGGRVSHYRPVLDSARQLVMHVWLFTLAMLPLRRRASRTGATPSAGAGAGRAARFFRWVNVARCWRELRDSKLGSLETSLAVALGALIGTSPFFGLHTAMCLYAAWRTRLHPAAVLIGSQVSIPPIGIALAGVSILTGRAVLGALATGDHPQSVPPLSWQTLPTLTWDLLLAWLVGSLLVGLAIALTLFVVLRVSLPIFRRKSALHVRDAQPD